MELPYNRLDDDCDPSTLDDDLDQDGHPVAEDCDDDDPAVHPGATEVCNARDDDCDGTIDGPLAEGHDEWFPDGDADGFGRSEEGLEDCWPGDGWTAAGGDCDDGDATVHPDAEEACGDGVDNDCDGSWGVCGLWGDVGLAGAQGRILGTRGDDDGVGDTLVGAQDWTGDGVPDVVLGTLRYSHEASVFLHAGPIVGDVPVDVAEASIRVALPDSGEPTERTTSPSSLALAGDLNADDLVDLVLTAHRFPRADGGQGIGVVLPGPLDNDQDLSGALLQLRPSEDYRGVYGGVGVGDLLGNGGADVAFAVGYDDVDTISSAGAVAIYSGDSSGTVTEEAADAILLGGVEDGVAGIRMAAEDLNGDGVPDLVASAPTSFFLFDGPGRGQVYVLLGPVSGVLGLEQDADTILRGEDTSSAAGIGLAIPGDLDGDGLPDLLVGAPSCSVGSEYAAGAAYIVPGTTRGEHALAGPGGAKLVGESRGAWAGYSVAGPGDVDGDGQPDLLIGSPFLDVDGVGEQAGAAYLVYGPVSGTVGLGEPGQARLTGTVAYGTAGLSVAAAGDMDLDGVPDLLVSAPQVPTTDEGHGAVYALSGALGL